ncbi:MAG TPA: ATP-binding protein, partial [Chloroflexota bacterium]|nr:ATP-binding protein [Chloroflexota bacterium]
DDIGLVAALERLVANYQHQLGLPVEFQTVNVEKLRLLPAAETALYRIAQAALNNVARHATAHAVSVLLQRRGDRLILVVEDDGRGFELAAIRSAPLKDRLGLAGIEERAQLIGARLSIESSPGHGTALFVDLSITSNLPPESAHAETTGAARG